MDKATAVDVAEIITPLRQRKRSFFLVLIIAVLPLWSIVPLSWFFVIYSLRTGLLWSFGWRGGACFAVALCEVRAYLCLPFKYLRQPLKQLSFMYPTGCLQHPSLLSSQACVWPFTTSSWQYHRAASHTQTCSESRSCQSIRR